MAGAPGDFRRSWRPPIASACDEPLPKNLQQGKLLGVSFQQIQKYETGINRMSAALMVSLGSILGVDIGSFYDEIPKTKRGGAIETSPLTEVVLSLHGRRLIDAFLKLKNDALRRAVADLAQALAR
jgi:hypothetical protein